MEPPSFSTTGPQIIRAAPGSDASIVLPLPSGSPPFEFEWSRAGAKLDDRFKRSDDAGGVRLTISAARTGDSGVYTLQANNAAGKDSTRVRLEVSPDETQTGEDPPTFLRRLQDLTVKVGTRTRFLVEIVSSTECRVTWYRNERRLLEAERIALVRDGSFWCADISAVSVDDAGRWTCTAENVGGRASCSAHLNVLVPKAYKRPEFVEELRALLTEQGTVSLECKVVGVPTPVLRWFKDSREIKAGDVFALTANAEDPTSLGTYTCEAVNCMGRAYSSSKVHVVGRSNSENSSRPSLGGITPEPPPIFTKELEDQFVRICESLTLSCHIVVPPWPRSVVWYNKEGKIEPSERYHILEDGVGGYLLEVPSAEWPDEGEWKCVATSSGGRVGISTCYVSMDVPKNYRKPRFMENLQAVLTEEGLVSFECKVVGFPTPLLSWFKDGQELKPGDVYQLTGTNSLGSYCCIARNCMGQASSSAELTVEDIQNQLNEEEKLQLFSRNQAPKFLQGLKSVEAKIDEPFRFTIKVALPPEPTILWYRDDQPVDESSRCHHGREERGVFYLDIQNLEFMDQAEWKCVAMNDYGHSVTSCFLKLIIPRHFKKPRFLENLQAILSDEGAVNLECKVIGVPQPVLKWYKDGEELKPGDIHRIISGQDGTCCLGTYTCEAQNCMGIAASSASLLGFEDSMKAKTKKKADEQALQRNLSLSTIHEERTSQMYDTPVGDMTLDEKGEISFSFDGKEVSVSLYETPDLTEEEALQIIEMYADQLSENVTEHNVVELPPLRFVKETSTSGNLLMEAIIVDVSPEYFTSPEEDLRTEADIEDISIAEDNGAPQISLDVEADGEDYLEKTIALLSDEKSDISKKLYRKKSDSQRSADDYFSLSRDQSLSEEKKDDDTQILSESDLQSFASARSSGKPKSKSSKPSIEDGQESSDITKTVVLREDLQNQMIETDVSTVKHINSRRSSRSSRRSSSGSEKSFSKIREDMADMKTESAVNVEKIDLNKEKVKTAMNGISLSLTEVINNIQILERDIILKSEFMATATTASNSLEMINTLITPLSEIHCITDAIREAVEYSENITSLLNNLPESLKNLQHSLTIINKCIDIECENKTLVTKTCMSIIKKCGQQLHNIIKDINTTVTNECSFVEKRQKSNIDTITTDLVSIINSSLALVNIEENKKSDKDGNVEEITLESKHLHDTQKAIYDLRGSLRSLFFIIEDVDITKANSFPTIKTSEIILNDMSTPIQDLQTALEQIETLSVTESKSELQKYNTEIIETAMESVLKLRTSFEQLSAEASNMEDKDALNEVLRAIKCNIKTISIQLDELEGKTGKFDILNNDNKLEALQKMAQILINLENNLPMLETVSGVKYHMTEFHKSLTKVLENVIESNDANKYFSLLEICDAVNRMNASIKSIGSNRELSLASIINALKIIQRNVSINLFQSELNSTLMSSIANTLVSIQESINKADELSLNENLDDAKDLSISKYEDRKVNVVIENIEKTIAAISNVISHETAKDMTLKRTIENVCPILVDLKYCIASLNVTSSDKNENLSDIESVSFSQSIANSLIELHQTINVLSQVICENADSEDFSQISIDYAKTLLDLCHTLETLQHNVVSQCIDNEANFDISSSIANIVKNFKSCIHLMIQEQPILEGTDDMSTLDDISGIKTTADNLSGDEFMIATIKENENVLFGKRQLLPALRNILQTLKDHIIILQNSNVLNVLKPVGCLEYTSMKSLIIDLDEICLQIESILHPITMESNQEQPYFTNFNKLLGIIALLQDIQKCLTNIDVNTIQLKSDVATTNPENFNFKQIKENIQNFESYLNYCMDIILSAVEIVNNTVDVSIKVVSLRQSCQMLHSSFLELEKPIESDEEIKADISRLKETIEIFLKTTMQQNTAYIKWAIENLYEVIVSVQMELTKSSHNRRESLPEDNIIIQIVHDIKKDIVALQECNFINLSHFNVLEKDVVEKLIVSKESSNKADNLIIYLKELVAPLEVIHNQLMDEKKNIHLEQLQEKFYEKIEKVNLELVKGQLININETVKKLEQYHSFDDISVNDDGINMVIKLNNTANDILDSIEYMKLTECTKTICQPIKVIKNILHRILLAEKDDGKQTLLKEKKEKLLQHMDHYIEIIEIVEEVSTVIKLEDLKETANIVRELQQSLINTDLTSGDSIQKASDGKIIEEQAEIAQRLHKALVSVQVQALENSRELVSSADEDIRQQIIQVVSDLQNDLIALASTNVTTEENLTTTAFESNIEEQNANIVLENQDQFKEIAKEEILLEAIQLTKHNEVESESKLSQSTYSNKNEQLNSSNQLSEIEKGTFNAGLILEELMSIEHDESKSEKLATINEILVENLNEYISESSVAVLSKLSHTLQSENFKKTIEIAKQLWNTTLSETVTSGKTNLTKYSTKQIELILNLNEAILITYPTTIEESQELENELGKEKLQSFKNVVANLRSILQRIINNIKTSPSVSDNDEFNERQKETNIVEFVDPIRTRDPSIADACLIENIRDLNSNIANNNLPKEVTKSLEINENLLNSEDNNCNKDIKTMIDTKELYEENKDLTSISSTIDQNILEFDTEPDKNKRFISKENLINHIEEYFCEQTVNDLLSLFKVEDIQPSIDIAHQLYDSFSSIGTEICNISTKQLKLALVLEKTVTSLLESTGQEIEDIKVLTGKKQLLRTNNVLSDLRSDLKTLIEIKLFDINMTILDLDDLEVHITREPFKYEIIYSNVLGTIPATERISENINDNKELKLPISYATEVIDDSNDASKTDITFEKLDDKNSMKEKNKIIDDLKEKLQPEDFGDDNSIIKLENLLKEVNDMIDISCDENLEVMQNSLDEVQTIIMKMKSDIDGSIGEAINETLEDLECNVRSVQLQIIENSPQALLKEACTNLQVLVAHISKLNEGREILRPMTNKVASDELDECSNDAMQTIELIEKVSCFKNTQHLEHIISSLNQIKDSIKSLRLKFLTNAETLIMGGVEIVQSIDQVEEKIFCLEKDLESGKDIDPMTRDHIISAVHCVYGSISNMRGTISNVQKKYMYENYGKPSRYFLTSIKNVRELIKKEKTTNRWKQFSQSLRIVLNHFEDIKFYINFDKTARLPGDAAFTKIILGELVSVLSREVTESVCNLDTEVIENVHDCVKYINRQLSDIESYTTLEVKDKIPIFKDLSRIILELTKNIIRCMQNEMMIKKDEDKTRSDLIPSQSTPYKENVNDKNTITNDVVNNEFIQTLSEIIKEDEKSRTGEEAITKQSVLQGMSTSDEIISTKLKEEIESTSIQQHQVESKFLQSNENLEMLANVNLENKYIVQTEGIPLEEDSCSKGHINTIEENYTDTINIKDNTNADLPETINEIEFSEKTHDKICGSEYLLDKKNKDRKTDDKSLPDIVSIDDNDEIAKKVDIKKQTQQQEQKQFENSKMYEKTEKYVNADNEKNEELLKIKEVEENVLNKQEQQHKKETVLTIERNFEELVDSSIENDNKQEKKPMASDINENSREQLVTNDEGKKLFIKSLEIKDNKEINRGGEKHYNKEFEEQEQECKDTLLPIKSTAKELLEISESADIPDENYKPQEIEQPKEKIVAANLKEKEESVKVTEIKEYEESTRGNEVQLKKEFEVQEQQQMLTVSTIESTVVELVEPFMENIDMLVEKSKRQAIMQVEEVQMCVSNIGEKQVTNEDEEKKEETQVKEYDESSPGQVNIKATEFKEEQEHQEKETLLAKESTVREPINTCVENIDMPTNKFNLQGTTQVEESVIYDDSEYQFTNNVEVTNEFLKVTEIKEDKEQIEMKNESRVAESLNTPDKITEILMDKSVSRKIEQVEDVKICNDSEKEVIVNIEEKEDSIKVSGTKEHEKSNTGEEDQFEKDFEKQERKYEETISNIDSKLEEVVTSYITNTVMPADKSKPQEMVQVQDSEIDNSSVKQVNVNLEDEEKFTKVPETKEYEESSTAKDEEFKKKFKDKELKETVSNIETSVKEPVETSLQNKDIGISNKSKLQEKEEVKDGQVCDNSEKRVTVSTEEQEKSTKELETKENEECKIGKHHQLKEEFKDEKRQEKETVSTIESILKESVDTSLKNKDMLVDKSTPQIKEEIKEKDICDSSKKLVIVSLEKNEESVHVMETKEDEESRISKEDQSKDQEQQQKECTSNIESKLKESVDTSLEHKDMLIDKSIPQKIGKIKEKKIFDNSEELVIVSLKENEKPISVVKTKEDEESTIAKEDQLNDLEQQQKETSSDIENKLKESVKTSLENENMLKDKFLLQETEQVKEKKICDDTEKQVIETEKSIEVLEAKEYEKSSTAKEDKIKKELRDQEQKRKETASTIEGTLNDSMNTYLENKDILADKSKLQEKEQVKDSKICNDINKQVNANLEEKMESIKILETKEYEKNNTCEECQFKDKDKDQKKQQKETILLSESMVAETVNIFAQSKDMPSDKSVIENVNKNFKEELTDNLESFDDRTKEKIAELDVQENKSDFSDMEIIKDRIKEQVKIETESTARQLASEEKLFSSQERYSETFSDCILEIATETQLDEILTKCDALDLQIQQEEKHYDKVSTEPKQEKILPGKEVGEDNIGVSTTVSYNDESIKKPVLQKEITETDIDKLMTKVDLFNKTQENSLLIQDIESTNTNEHITQQERIDILNSNQLIHKEDNQNVYKAEDDKHAIVKKDISARYPLKDKGDINNIYSDETLILEANNNDLLLLPEQDTKSDDNDIEKNKEKTLDTKVNTKASIEHIDNGQTRKQKNEKEIKKEAVAKIDGDKLTKEETQDSKTENLKEEKRVRYCDIEEKLIENLGKISVQTITEVGNIEKEISILNNPIKKENAEIKIERDPFSDVLSDFSVTESVSKIAYNSKDELKGSKNKLEETCGKKLETEKIIDNKCLEFNDNIDRNVAKSSDTKEYSETNLENKTEIIKNFENDLVNIINDFNKKTISTTQNIEVLENQDSKKQLMVEKEGVNIDNTNIDMKQKTLTINNEDSQGGVNRYREVNNSCISEEKISQNLQRRGENTDKIENLKHSEEAKDSHLLEQAQQVEKNLNDTENSEQIQTIIQENPIGKEESEEQIQEEKKNSEKKLQELRRRSKKSRDTSKPEAENEKSEEKPQETNEKNVLVEGKTIDMTNFTDPNIVTYCTKPDDANVIFKKDDKQNQDSYKNIEQRDQIKTDVQKYKLGIKETEHKFLYEKEAENDRNKNETHEFARQLNENESIETSENKKEIIIFKKEKGDRERKRKEKRQSHDESKINPEEKEVKDKKLEELGDYDISKQLKQKTLPTIKDMREGQMASEQTKKIMNTIIADNILTDLDSEFSRPPGYIAKAFYADDTTSKLQITNNKVPTIYKVQTLRHESQLRYSMPPHLDQASDVIEARSQIKEKTKAASECRSTLSEKRCSSSRDVKRKPVFSTFLTDRTAVESSRVKLTCTVLTPTDPKVTWYKNGVQLENKHKFRSKFVDGLITLEIFNALPSDSGEYSCRVENENGSVTSSANLKVYPSFEASPIPPTFTRSIRDIYHLVENELVLECRIRGQPLPTITWLKDDKPIVHERYQAQYLADGVCRLTISNPTTEDSGKYTCKAESSVWSDEITHDVYFTGKKGRSSPNIATVEKLHFNRLGPRRPHFTNVLSDHKVVTGGTIGLQVEIRGSPTRVEWLREGHSVTELYRNAQTYVDHDIYTLALPDVTEKESGLYTCRAYSKQGNVDMNASITVVQPNQYEGKPATIVSRPEKDVIISVGEDLNISFRVNGEPKAKVFLMKGIRDLTNSQRVCKMTSNDYVKFTLKRTVVSDAGTYCIYVRNAYGCDRAFVTVVIRQRASSENLISDWTYPMDDLAISSLDRNYKSVPDRIPSEPSVVQGGNNWVSLAWPKSDHQSRAPILAYKVESWLLGKDGGARWLELGITPRNSFDAFNLKQGEEYHFRVTPRNRYGWGESVQTSVPIGIGFTGDRPEFVEILPGQLKVLVGEKAILRCSFTGKPIPEIVWMKNGHEIEEEPGRVIIEMNNFHTSLRIEEVKIDDEGRYSCEATNIHGRSSTYARMAVITDRQIWEADAKLKRERSAGIDGEYPPQFTMRLRDRRVQATYPVRLTCQVVGNPRPVVKWFKNKEEVIIGGRYTASQDECFYTLEIAPTALEDGGVYEAMARNGCGAVSSRCNLVVDKGIRAYIAPEFCCGLEPLYRLSEGEELRISAIVEAYPSVGVTWYRDGVRLRSSRRAIMTLDRDGQIELALASVTARDAGVYTCTASNEVGMASTSGKVEVVSGEYVIEKTSAPPILISSDMPYSKEPMFIRKPRSSEAREGDTVIIECEVTGDPKPDVYWLRDFLKPDYYRDSSHFKRIDAGPAYRFEIPHAKLDYTGAYSVVAKNIHGETKAIISLQILAKDLSCGDDAHNIKYGRVEVIPRFNKELTDLLCYDGDAVEFECSVSGNPDPEIRWLHYNENVPECSYFETSYDEGTARLKIKQVTAEDEGTYTCEASNCLGKASSSACLVVYPPGEPNTLSTRLRRPPALLSAASTPRSTPRTTPARSMSRTPGPESRHLYSPSREIAPKFYTYPFNRVAEEGDTVVFQCAVKGLPPPWATWDKDGIIITPSARITIKEKDEMLRILEIEQVTIEDVGLYRISLENDYGRAEASARLEVITQTGKFYGSTRSYSVSPRKTLPYRRRTPSFSKQD